MKLLAVTFKDLRQSARNMTAIMFMFVVPLLVTLLFFLMFSGFGGDDEGFSLPRTSVVVADLDQGQLPAGFAQGLPAGADLGQAQSMGQVLVSLLEGQGLAEVLDVSQADSEEAARARVDGGDTDVAIIIPANFSAAILGQTDAAAAVELYQDPTLTFGPAIVESILSQVLDAFAASRIGVELTLTQLEEAGVTVAPADMPALVSPFTSAGPPPATRLIASASPESGSNDVLSDVISVILAGMMVFFAFFTGSASVQSILVEEEKGTLSRLFTTPTDPSIILNGKVLAAFVTLAVQVTVLLIFGRVVFRIDWGAPLPLFLAGLGIIIIAGTTGLFLVSLLKDTRQSGIIFGGVLTMTGMLGLIPVFTAGVPNQSPLVQTASLLVPHGWAARGLIQVIEGAGVADLLPTLAGILVWSAVFGVIGQLRLRRRFA